MTTTNTEADADLVSIIDEEPPAEATREVTPWRILVVDDDNQVHETTTLALRGTLLLDRPLELLHARSAAEARHLLADTPDVAVALVDVVMESEDAGLRLVRAIRGELGLDRIRIILRTGQPGYAPELEVIRHYDINDYRTKSELSRTRLITSLTSALRTYEQLCALQDSHLGLTRVIKANSALFEQHDIDGFASTALAELDGLIGDLAGSMLCVKHGNTLAGADKHEHQVSVIGAAGRLAGYGGEPLDAIGETPASLSIRDALNEQRNLFASNHAAFYLGSGNLEGVLYLQTARPLTLVELQLAEVFATNIASGLTNVYLFRDLNRIAFHDTLTGLPNRQGLLDLYDRLQTGQPGARTVTLLDIDHFAEINNALGMEFGNQVLRGVCRRLCQELSPKAQVGRFGGDVVAVIAHPDQVSIETIMAFFGRPFDIDGYSLPLRVTAGQASSLADLHRDSGAQIFQRAGLALSHAKREQRGGFQRFVQEMTAECRQRLDMSSSLKHALVADQLALYYQPKIDLDSGAVVGAEALLRWNGDSGELAPPSLFIPLAEQSGLILEIGAWVIDKAAAQLQSWADSGLGELHLAINVSAQQVLSDAVVKPLRDAIERHGIRPGLLEVEITESVVINDFDKVVTCMNALKELGVPVALDDFGTGFSSLSYLQRLPIDALKVDRSFISDIGVTNQSERIAEMIIALGKLLDLTTVAEGIETEQQHATARRWGCRIGQGYLYSPALPAEEFEQWVRDRQAR